jgi:phosphoserine phosphatase
LVFNPATPLHHLDHLMHSLDLVLIMSVNPGFGGQSFIPGALDKLRRVRQLIDASGRDIRLEIDGGVKPTTSARSRRRRRHLRRRLGDLQCARLCRRDHADARQLRGGRQVSSAAQASAGLSQDKLRRILDVTLDLARPFDLDTMLYTIVDAAKELLDAEGGTVWQYQAGDRMLEMRVARGLDAIRIPADRGIVGECVRTLSPINVPTATPTRASTAISTGPAASAPAACSACPGRLRRPTGRRAAGGEPAHRRVRRQRRGRGRRAGRAMRSRAATHADDRAPGFGREIAPGDRRRPRTADGHAAAGAAGAAGYDFAGLFEPTDDTGGDTYDFVPCADGRIFVLMGDATGHGIGRRCRRPRCGRCCGSRSGSAPGSTTCFGTSTTSWSWICRRIASSPPSSASSIRARTSLRYHSGGQGPLLHFRAADLACEFSPPTTFPMGAMPLPTMKPARVATLAPGDVFALVSDGVYEYQDAEERQFGEEGVAEVLRRYHDRPMPYLLGRLMEALREFGRGAPQLDDVTVVLIRRLPLAAVAMEDGAAETRAALAGAVADLADARQSFPRSFDALPSVFEFIQRCVDGVGADARYAVEFTVEELFTNMVKYNPRGAGEIELAIARAPDQLVCRLSDPDSGYFDVTAAPDVDIRAGAESRQPGGLGLHLIRRLVDSLEYDYSGRTSRITFRKLLWEHMMFEIEQGEGGRIVFSGRLDAAQCAKAQAFLDAAADPANSISPRSSTSPAPASAFCCGRTSG